jgi:hypothetical protein
MSHTSVWLAVHAARHRMPCLLRREHGRRRRRSSIAHVDRGSACHRILLFQLTLASTLVLVPMLVLLMQTRPSMETSGLVSLNVGLLDAQGGVDE